MNDSRHAVVPGPLRSARIVARILDNAFRIPGLGVRFGIDGLLGLVPGGGDAIGAVLASYILFVGIRLRAPASLLVRMLLNIAIDAAVGTIPLIGDAFDIGWKANARNVALLERWLQEPEKMRAASRIAIAATLALALLLIASVVAAAIWVFRVVLRTV